jgi:hypothetical protein
MADDERHDDESLELPTLRSVFRRRRERPAERAETPAGASQAPERPAGAGSADDDSASQVLTAAEVAGPRPRRQTQLHLPGPIAAIVTGAVVGLVLVGLTAASLHLCSVLRGTSSCGKPGVLLLLLITVVVIVLGSLLLRLTGVAPTASTSVLGIALLDVLILIALLPVLDEWWVVITVPVVAMVCYLAAWWLTTTYVEPGERRR